MTEKKEETQTLNVMESKGGRSFQGESVSNFIGNSNKIKNF